MVVVVSKWLYIGLLWAYAHTLSYAQRVCIFKTVPRYKLFYGASVLLGYGTESITLLYNVVCRWWGFMALLINICVNDILAKLEAILGEDRVLVYNKVRDALSGQRQWVCLCCGGDNR